MKNILACTAIVIIFACAQKENKQPQENTNGTFVKATINGKAWTAARMTVDYSYPANSNNKLVHGEQMPSVCRFTCTSLQQGIKDHFLRIMLLSSVLMPITTAEEKVK